VAAGGIARRNAVETVLRPALRVLQLLGNTNRGGIETWLLRILPMLQAHDVKVDLLVHHQEEGDYEVEFRRLGCTILRCGDHRRPWSYVPRFLSLLRTHGPYDVVHGQLYLLNGLHMRLAHRAGVPHRIAHMHPGSDVRARAFGRTLYRMLMARWIAAHATCIMYPSLSSAEVCKRLGHFEHLPHQLVPNCIDLVDFQCAVDRAAARRSLALPDDRPLVVYIGRFVAHKNHALVFAIADDLAARGLKPHFALAGSHGDCLPRLQEKARARSDVTILVGLTDIASLLLAADVFVMPTLEEGFGVVALEAQAAGLPVVASDLPALREALSPCAQELVFAAGDHQGAASHIARLLGDAGLRQRAGADGRAFSARFTVTASANAVLEAYRRGIAARPAQEAPAWTG
jgi:glycosyltransferase involved in cell wall biosynthesis